MFYTWRFKDPKEIKKSLKIFSRASWVSQKGAEQSWEFITKETLFSLICSLEKQCVSKNFRCNGLGKKVITIKITLGKQINKNIE